jgi:cytochrome c-type biogenesis protein CcmH/NrfF
VTVRESLDLWDMPIVLIVLASLLATEWSVRRRRGLA